ncbi:hypothetical protein Dsin_029980 [Dipteronia sinensis]|uniref:Reverse transcriptase zinc-binding domain-containing protein n=1 Tax=Dipteronia sinensis TaxID=43782 RepID=A0AAD9ZK17_9ROSI|nr:hypothetical protein Dsin_029980 [Dipteronia sinensis]
MGAPLTTVIYFLFLKKQKASFPFKSCEIPLGAVENKAVCDGWIDVPSEMWTVVANLLKDETTSNRVLRYGLKVVNGNGRRGNFWDIPVRENARLNVVCPRTYALAVQKHGVIHDFMMWQDGKWVWVVPMHRPLFDRGKEQWRIFKSFLDCITIRNSVANVFAWSHLADGMFSVSSFLSYLENSPLDSHFDFNLVWKGISHPKTEIFIWQLIPERILVCQVL